MALGWLGWCAWAGVAGVAAAAVGVAGVTLCDIHLRFTWQAWYLVTSTVAGRARMALGWLRWRAWAGVAGVAAAAVGVAGMALCDIHLRFTWQAWYLVTSTFTLCGRRGRRGTHGIGLALW